MPHAHLELPVLSRPALVASMVAVAVAVAVAACSGGGPSPSVDPTSRFEPVELTIFGAASLKRALERAEAAYEAAVPGTTITVSIDSSAALATQIEQGAPADVFLSADTTHPRGLADKGLTMGDPVTFAGNRLTIIVPADNRAGVTSPADLARRGIKVIAAGDDVPITAYAAQLVENLATEAGYPADIATAYDANVVSREDSVKAILAKIELGEGDAGIVYVTDAAASDKVTTIDVPDESNVRATYDGVVVKASDDVAASRAFLDWFAGAGGQAILGALGFLPPG